MLRRHINRGSDCVPMRELGTASRCVSSTASMSYTTDRILTRFVDRNRRVPSLTVIKEGMDMLEQAKHKHVVAPGINWLIATLHDAEAVGVKSLRTITFSDLDSSDTHTRRLSK